MSSYAIKVRDKSGTHIGEFTTWKDLKFSEKLNRFGSCSFTAPHDDDFLNKVALRAHEVEIVKDGTIVWAGELAHRNAVLQANSSNRVTFNCFTFLEMLNHRYTDGFSRFDATDQGAILKSLVDTSQAKTDGDLGLTFGTVETTVNRDREYSYFNIMEAFINMSNVINGPDFKFKFDKEIDIVSRKGSDRSGQIVFEWGTNFEAVEIQEDFVHPGNEAITIGSGFGSAQVVSTRTDTEARRVHKLRQVRTSEIDVSSSGLLDAKGDEVLREKKQPILGISFTQLPTTTPALGTLETGDTVKVKIDSGVYNINNNFRIYEISVSVSDDGKESISYLVGLI